MKDYLLCAYCIVCFNEEQWRKNYKSVAQNGRERVNDYSQQQIEKVKPSFSFNRALEKNDVQFEKLVPKMSLKISDRWRTPAA